MGHDRGAVLAFGWARRHPDQVAGIGHVSSRDHEVYRESYREPGERRRRPMLGWAQQVPFDGEPAETAAVLDGCARFLRTSPTRKLFIRAEPGSILVGEAADLASTFPNQTEVTLRASHFVPEDDPEGVAAAVSAWLEG